MTKTAMQTQSVAQSQAQTQTGTLLAIAFVAMLGAVTVFTVGLAHSATLHDAAHDTRHATGFPCH